MHKQFYIIPSVKSVVLLKCCLKSGIKEGIFKSFKIVWMGVGALLKVLILLVNSTVHHYFYINCN